MKPRLLAALLLALSHLGACQSPGMQTGVSPAKAKLTGPVEQSTRPGPSLAARANGVPHSVNIDKLALTSDGAMAMSRDAIGGLRFWSALDGKAQPALVPIRGARSFTLAAHDGAEPGATLAVIDAIGALHILHTNLRGDMRELHMSSPHAPLRKAVVLQGGKRVLTLGQDHSLALLDRSGKTLSTLQERRFRPSDFRTSNGDSLIATLSTSESNNHLTVTLRQVRIAGDSLKLVQGEIEFTGVRSLDEKLFSLAPDGTAVAFLGSLLSGAAEEKSPEAPSLILWKLGAPQGQRVELNLLPNEVDQIGLGFVDNKSVILSSRPSGGSWRVTLGAEATSRALPSAVAQDSQHSAHAFAKDVHLAADGTWLFVQNTRGEASHHYLGYGAFDPQHASISPTGDWVAWTTTQTIFIESLTGIGKSIRIAAPPSEAFFRASFIDEQHLVAVDFSGGLHLLDWESGHEMGAIDTGGAVRDFEVDQKRKLIRGVRQSGGSWLCELAAKTLKGPYLIQNQGQRSGFLAGDRPLWTTDANQGYHSYHLDELRAGLAAGELRATPAIPANIAPLAIDALGRRYQVKAEEQGITLSVDDGSDNEVQRLPLAWSPLRVHPSPDASLVLLISPDSAVIEVYDLQTGSMAWSMRGTIGELAWSGDSQFLALPSPAGATVVAARSGKPVRTACGPWFEKRPTAPISTLSFSSAPNLCER